MEQSLPVGCWHCGKTFHARIQASDYRAEKKSILKEMPCPYCDHKVVISLKAATEGNNFKRFVFLA